MNNIKVIRGSYKVSEPRLIGLINKDRREIFFITGGKPEENKKADFESYLKASLNNALKN